MIVHMSVIEEQVVFLEVKNLELKEPLSLMIEKSGKRKGEATSLQTEKLVLIVFRPELL